MRNTYIIISTFIIILLTLFPRAVVAEWLQTVGGDVHSEGLMRFNTATEFVSQEFVSIGDSGVLTHNDGSPETGLGSESPVIAGGSGTDWIFNSSAGFPRENLPNGPKYGFSYYSTILEPKNSYAGATPLTTQELAIIPSGVYTYTGDLNVGPASGGAGPLVNVTGSKWYVFLVDGDVRINKWLQIVNDGFIGFIASGDIIFRNALIGSTATPHATGFFLADGKIVTTGFKNEALYAAGVFIGWSGFQLDRIGSGGLEEQFIFYPQILIDAPAIMKESNATWQEVAP
ncbi:MAG TPA: hypothetical protein VJL83_00280 [Patescibacteria group bacterium]|nr:hypothetical protein [Patescibacteria group bacterium]